MPDAIRTRRQGLQAALLSCLISLAAAAPVSQSRHTPPAAGPQQETPAGREYRAGIQALVNGDLAAAQAKFEAVLKGASDDVPALLGLAAVHQARKAPSTAESYLRRAERVQPSAPEVLLARGRYQLGQGDTAGAEKAIRAAVDADPGKLPPLLELGDLLMRSPQRKAEALSVFRQAVAAHPGNAYAQYGLGLSAAVNSQREEAQAALERAAALRPKDPSALQAIGQLQLEAGAVDKALAAFDGGLLRQPKSVPLMMHRADALLRAGRGQEALVQLQAAESLVPKAAAVKLKLGEVYLSAGRPGEAEAQFLEALKLDAKNPLAYNNLAWMTVERKGDLKQAVAWARQAVSLAPKASAFHDTLGWAERAAGNLAGAVTSLQRAVELDPQVAGYHYHLGVVQSENKQLAESRASLKRALELDPRMPDAGKAQALLSSLAPG
ncbi:MAG: tetratricopeptide repeat protein [Rubrivivax sp.]|nr:tetratricopeptide repeat protein [Rubrivivax sp.]